MRNLDLWSKYGREHPYQTCAAVVQFFNFAVSSFGMTHSDEAWQVDTISLPNQLEVFCYDDI